MKTASIALPNDLLLRYNGAAEEWTVSVPLDAALEMTPSLAEVRATVAPLGLVVDTYDLEMGHADYEAHCECLEVDGQLGETCHQGMFLNLLVCDADLDDDYTRLWAYLSSQEKVAA